MPQPFALELAWLWAAMAGYAASAVTAVGARRGVLPPAAGAWVSWMGLPSVLLIAAASGLAGALLRGLAEGKLSARRRLPFGPYLAAGLWLVWLYGPVTAG